MMTEGPALEPLLRRIAETPADFLAAPRIGERGVVQVPAVLGDLARQLRLAPTVAIHGCVRGPGPDDANRLSVQLLLAWLLAAEAFQATPPGQQLFERLFLEGARDLATQTLASKFVADPDRREELVRFALAQLSLRPSGETEAQAQDRLTSLSAVERARVMAASRAAERRAREIREALTRQAAQEAADKYTRE